MTPSSRSPSISCAGILLDKRPAHLHLHLRILPPVALDVLQQIERGGLVGADHEPAGRVVAQLGQRVFQIALQVLEAPRVIAARSARRR